MDIALALVAIILGAAVPFWLHKRENPAREIRYGVQSSRLMSPTLPGDAAASMNFQGREVHDPYKVSIRLWSSGRADVPSAAFDGGQPLVLDLGAFIIPGTFRTGVSPTGLGFTPSSDHEVAIGPGLVAKTFDVTLEAIVDREPQVSVRSSLIDVAVIPEQQPSAKQAEDVHIQRVRRRSRVTALRVTLGLTIAAAVVLVVALVLYQVDTKMSAAVGAVALLVLMMCAVALLVIGVARLVRFIGATARGRSARIH